jgi:hypothetical protein
VITDFAHPHIPHCCVDCVACFRVP